MADIADRGGAGHAMTLWGAPADARFPPLCPNCGQPAASRLKLAKSFLRASGSDTPNETVVLSVDVPFCDVCITRHRAELATPNRLLTLATGFASGEMVGAVGFGAAALFTGYQALRELLRGRFSHCLVFALLTAFFALVARFLARSAWHDTEHARVAPPTSVSSAFDYGDNEPAPFQAPRYTCSVRDARCFAAFEALNRGQAVRPGSAAVVADRRQARRQSWVVGGVVVTIAIFFAVLDWLK